MAIRTRAQALAAKATARKRPTSAKRPKPRSRGALASIARALGVSSRNVSPEQKATYHHVTGAGRSRVKRQFFDLSDTELQKLADMVNARITARLKTATGSISV